MIGILFAFQFFFLFVYLVATELNSSTASTAEKLVFRRGHAPASVTAAAEKKDEEVSESPSRLAAGIAKTPRTSMPFFTNLRLLGRLSDC